MVAIIGPGKGLDSKGYTRDEKMNITTADTLMDLARNLIPPNIIQATMQQQVTTVSFDPNLKNKNNQTIQDRNDTTTWNFKTGYQDNTNILGLIAWSLLFGLGIAVVGEPAKPLVDLFTAVVEVTTRMTMWIICIAPIGIIFLVAGQIVDMKDPENTFFHIVAYFITVMIALFVHGLIILPTIYGK